MSIDVALSLGVVRGVQREASCAFRGIPYAESTAGEARFRAPTARLPWEGVLDATRPGAIALQGAVFAAGVGAEGVESEDCLTLNVFTPACDGRARPVMFWIHGGAFTVGTACTPLYDGRHLAEAHDVVVVSANYRLGALGFLAVDADAQALGAVNNAGLLDLAEALRWLRLHISAFGGDAENVTIFGESAGGSLVCALLAHAPARGLFKRAIAQSAVDPTQLASLETGLVITRALLAELGCAHVAQLRTLPLAELKRGQAAVEAQRGPWPHFFPVRDDSLPNAPADALLHADTPRVPLLLGYNRDEWNLFDAGSVGEWSRAITDDDAIAQLTAKLPSAHKHAAAALFDAYRASRSGLGLRADARSLVRAIVGDSRFRVGSQTLAGRYAEREPDTYVYVFCYGSPALRGALGACHALELPFVFGTLNAPNQDRFAGKGAVVEALSRDVQHAWARFARGNAPTLASGAAWPRYDAVTRSTMVFDVESRVEADPFGAERVAFTR